jgi:LysR family transcriptional regulator for bpeEF and oprC
VSKAITRLEARLGVRLLNRTSRSVSLTDEGRTFLHACRDAVNGVRGAEEQVSQNLKAPRGQLSLSLPLMLGKLVILPALKQLSDRHPALTVRASLTDRFVQLEDEELDAVVRVGVLPSSRFPARRLRNVRWVTVASPGYLARRGVPAVPGDLAAHNCLKFLLPNGIVRGWEYAPRDGTEATETPPTRGSLIADHGEALVEAALSGLGLFQAHDYVVTDALAQGRLVEVLAEFAAPGPPISLLLAPGRRSAAKVRAFVEFIVELLG